MRVRPLAPTAFAQKNSSNAEPTLLGSSSVACEIWRQCHLGNGPARPLAPPSTGIPVQRSPPLPFQPPARPAPMRHTALARPHTSLWAAIHNWLYASRKLFMVKRPIRPAKGQQGQNGAKPWATPNHFPTHQPSLRDRTELIQLQAENRRLRQQLERLSPHGGSLSAKAQAPRHPSSRVDCT